MMPLGDDDSARRTLPVVTYALIAINVLVFVLLELPNPNLDEFINRWGTIPAEIMAGRGLLTLLTSMFLHGGWAHLGGNMLFLWIFGDNVEDAFGHVLYLIFYLVTGLAASMAQVLLSPSSTIPGVGASGAISGVLAGYIVMFGSNRVRVLMGGVLTTVPAYVMIGLWIVVQFLNGFASIANTAQTDGVAYGAHVGGFIAGLVLTFLLRGFTRQQSIGTVRSGRSQLR
jgi:membrane associated rhomboid family serine protease